MPKDLGLVFASERAMMNTLDIKPFVDHAHAAVHGLRRALAELLSSVGADPDQPQDISRKFLLDKTLTWRISRVVREEDAWEAIQHIPRRPSFRLLVSAMESRGAPDLVVAELWRALENFESFVETHSGDRETLEIMCSVAARRTAGKRLEVFRKSGFQASSALWGVRATAHLGVHILYPKPGSDNLLTGAVVCGLSGFRRLRPDVPWSIATLSRWDAPGSETNRGSVRPIDRAITAGAPLLRDFCSQAPEMLAVPESSSRTRYMIAPGPVGNTATADVMMGWVYEDMASRYESAPGELGEHGLTLTTPAEVAIHELWVHRSLSFARNVGHAVYSRLPGGPTFPEHKTQHLHPLPVASEVIDVGSPPDTTLPELPRYAEMMSRSLTALGLSMPDFQAYRCRMAYPPIPTISVLSHPLLKP